MFAMVLWSLSMSLAPFIGQNWGAGAFSRVKYSFSLANRFSVAWGIAAYVFLMVCSPFFLEMVTEDAAVVAVALQYMMIAPLGMAVMGIGSNGGSFNALGKPIPPC